MCPNHWDIILRATVVASETERRSFISSNPTFVPVLLESRRDVVTTLTLNRPERLNALNSELGQALVHSLVRIAKDVSVRAIIVTGAGRGFCSGGDI